MAYASPTAGSALNSPSHSLLHRQFDIDTSASEQSMVIDAAGQVGIGTTSPLELLSLGTAGTTAGVLSLAGATSGKAIIDVSAEAGTPTLTLPTTTGTLALTSDIPTLPVKAIGSELDTGSDDAKFATAKAIKDSHNVPSVVPSTDGNVLTSDGTDWISAAGTAGTVTSVAALTLGTTGTDVSSTVADGTSTPVITLQIPTASTANRGALSSTDWNTFNGKLSTLAFAGLSDYPADAAGALSNDGSGNLSWSALGAGDMILASAQSNTGIKTFDKGTLKVKGTSTGVTDLTTANTSATSYTQTFPARNGTVANLDNVTYIGTTSVALNRTTDTLNLAGIGTLGVGAITTTGNLSQTGATTFGTGTGTVSINGSVQIASAKTLKFNTGATVGTIGTTFADNDTSLMTSQAIKEKIENYSYATTTAPTFATSITGSYLTASEMLITDADKKIVSAAVATYPSLTELAYVKGLSSSIQTQLGNKAASGANSDITSITGLTTDLTIAQGGTGASTLAGASIPTYTSTNTFTNKRITQRVVTTANDATAEIDIDITDVYELSAIADDTTFTLTGTPTDGQKLIVRFKDAGTTKALTWTGFTAVGITLPTTTVVSKWHLVGCIYNLGATTWDAVAYSVEA